MIQFWDMDHTMINNDCDVSWKDFVIAHGLADESAREKADFFYQQYLEKCLDIDAFLSFQLEEFKGRSLKEMRDLCIEHCNEFVVPHIYQQAVKLIKEQQQAGDIVCMITATNRYIAEPVAKLLGIEHILATELEVVNDHFNGELSGTYCCAAGKLVHMQKFCDEHNATLEDVSYYGDSSNDIVIMEGIGYPKPTNPSPGLEEAALLNNWPILKFV